MTNGCADSAVQRLFAVAWLMAFGAIGCVVPVAAGLDEGQAQRVVVALDRGGSRADTESEPASDSKSLVVVERTDAPRAIAALRDEELPAPTVPGLLDSMGKGSLVPSQL